MVNFNPCFNIFANTNSDPAGTGCEFSSRIPGAPRAANAEKTMDQPKLRPIEAFPVKVGGRDVIGLRDPTDATGHAMLVPHETLFMLAHFDGQHSILDIQEAYTRQYGQLIFSDAIKALIAKLDEHLLLDNEYFRAHKQQLIEAFRQSSVRPAAHVGMKFGDQGPLTPALLEQVVREDQALLAATSHMDAAGFFRSIAEHQDRRRICGFPPTYMLLSTMPATTGTVLKYDQAVEPATQSMASYASVVFH